jgi:hypothetical protein
VTELEPSELAWVLDKIRGERGTILLSHHPLFSWAGVGNDGEGRRLAVNPRLHEALAPALDAVDAWFWGHEHNLGIYAPYAGLARGRGIGSGAIPILVEQRPYDPAADLVLPSGEGGPPAPLPGTALGHNGVVYNHAFVLLDLDGPTATARYFQSDTTGGEASQPGVPFFTEVISRT